MEEKPTASHNSTPPKTPTWVKVFFIVIALLILIVIAVHLMGVRFDHSGATGSLRLLMSYAKPLQAV